jgi:hypothetical protein
MTKAENKGILEAKMDEMEARMGEIESKLDRVIKMLS